MNTPTLPCDPELEAQFNMLIEACTPGLFRPTKHCQPSCTITTKETPCHSRP